jgi:hypothetical protein
MSKEISLRYYIVTCVVSLLVVASAAFLGRACAEGSAFDVFIKTPINDPYFDHLTQASLTAIVESFNYSSHTSRLEFEKKIFDIMTKTENKVLASKSDFNTWEFIKQLKGDDAPFIFNLLQFVLPKMDISFYDTVLKQEMAGGTSNPFGHIWSTMLFLSGSLNSEAYENVSKEVLYRVLNSTIAFNDTFVSYGRLALFASTLNFRQITVGRSIPDRPAFILSLEECPVDKDNVIGNMVKSIFIEIVKANAIPEKSSYSKEDLFRLQNTIKGSPFPSNVSIAKFPEQEAVECLYDMAKKYTSEGPFSHMCEIWMNSLENNEINDGLIDKLFSYAKKDDDISVKDEFRGLIQCGYSSDKYRQNSIYTCPCRSRGASHSTVRYGSTSSAPVLHSCLLFAQCLSLVRMISLFI